MVKESVLIEIDRTIKDVWLKNIKQDYMSDSMINEDCLKVCMYYHMRRRLATILKENNLRIYTEYTIPELKYRADMVIAEYDPEWEEKNPNLYSSIKKDNIVALIELKFTLGGDQSTQEWIKRDTYKFRDYMQKAKMACQFYFAVVYETPCEWLYWMDKRSSEKWAKGFVSELNAGYINDVMRFGVHSYNGMNPELDIEV